MTEGPEAVEKSQFFSDARRAKNLSKKGHSTTGEPFVHLPLGARIKDPKHINHDEEGRTFHAFFRFCGTNMISTVVE